MCRAAWGCPLSESCVRHARIPRGANSLTKDGHSNGCVASPWRSKLNVVSGTQHTASVTYPAGVRLIRDRRDITLS
jgi:hypothetical protein